MKSIFLLGLILSQLALGQLKMTIGGHEFSTGGGGGGGGRDGGGGDYRVWDAIEDAKHNEAMRQRDCADNARMAAAMAAARAFAPQAPSFNQVPISNDAATRTMARLDEKRLNEPVRVHRDYEFKTDQNSEYGLKLREALDQRNEAAAHVQTSQGRFFLRAADSSLDTADSYYAQQLYEYGEIAREYAIKLIDLATSWTPGVSWGRDWYEALTGKDAISGEALGTFDRSLAIIGSASCGVGSKLGKGLKILNEVVGTKRVLNAHRWKDSLAKAEHLAEEVIQRFGPMRHGRAHEIIIEGTTTVADTFRGQSYFSYATSKDLALYRVQSMPLSKEALADGDKMLGRYWTRQKPDGPVQAVVDLALDHNFKNSALHWVEIKVPKGTVLHEGRAARQGGLVGGGSQVFIEAVPMRYVTQQGSF